MKVLIDTHILVWFAEGIDKLSPEAKLAIESANNQRFVSVVSLWEIVIKTSLNKLELQKNFAEINKFLVNNDISLLTVKIAHLNTLLTLPLYHKDPFDCLLIAQAITENLTLISADQHFQAYPVNLLQ